MQNNKLRRLNKKTRVTEMQLRINESVQCVFNRHLNKSHFTAPKDILILKGRKCINLKPTLSECRLYDFYVHGGEGEGFSFWVGNFGACSSKTFGSAKQIGVQDSLFKTTLTIVFYLEFSRLTNGRPFF